MEKSGNRAIVRSSLSCYWDMKSLRHLHKYPRCFYINHLIAHHLLFTVRCIFCFSYQWQSIYLNRDIHECNQLTTESVGIFRIIIFSERPDEKYLFKNISLMNEIVIIFSGESLEWWIILDEIRSWKFRSSIIMIITIMYKQFVKSYFRNSRYFP